MRILIARNRISVPVDDDIEKFVSFFREKTPLKLEIDYVDTDITPKYAHFSTGTDGKMYYGTTGTKEALEKVVPKGVYDSIVFMYGNEQKWFDGDRAVVTSWTFFRPLYDETAYTEIITNKWDDSTGWIWKSMCHEFMHVLCSKFLAVGITGLDEMDMTKDGKAYYKNDDPYAEDGNYARTLKNMEPHWSKLKSLAPTRIATITRDSDDGVQTLGTFSHKKGGLTITCKTLERPWLNNQRNVSCIPKGTYLCRWTFSPKFGRHTYEVTGVPNRSGIRFHKGNYFTDIDGCILMGSGYADMNGDGSLDIRNSTVVTEGLPGIMGRQDFLLVIK